jgi:NAD(P)-dependent dehydrogenase (short-subunit alcohol dehydrogenase family)
MENITGKNVVVFGGCGGMGCVITTMLVKNNVKNLVISDYYQANDDTQNLMKANKNVFYERGDVSSKEFVQSFFKKYFDKFGYIDVVINLAAILDENQIERTQQINVVRI